MANEKTSTTLDKSGWESGPWQSEPDRVEFTFAGLPCLMVRASHGAWCGYVTVPEGHPWHGQRDVQADVHGCVTYTAADESGGWVVGFDCHHLYDHAPAPKWSEFARSDSMYRDLGYVRGQTESLAAQALAARVLAERDAEIARLRAENEALKAPRVVWREDSAGFCFGETQTQSLFARQCTGGLFHWRVDPRGERGEGYATTLDEAKAAAERVAGVRS